MNLVKMLRHARIQPFETAIAALIVCQGIIALTGGNLVDPGNALLPQWLAIAIQCTYSLAGLVMLIGLSIPRGDVEGAGLILLSTGLVGRALLFGVYLGWDSRALTALLFSALLACACAARLVLLQSGMVLIIGKREDAGDDDDPS